MCAIRNNEAEKISVIIFHTTSIRLVSISNYKTFLRVLDLMQLFDLGSRVRTEIAQILRVAHTRHSRLQSEVPTSLLRFWDL